MTFEWTDYNNATNKAKAQMLLNPELHKDLQERAKLEMIIVKCSKKIWGDNSTEYVVGLLSSIVSKEQLRVLANNLIKDTTEEMLNEYYRS